MLDKIKSQLPKKTENQVENLHDEDVSVDKDDLPITKLVTKPPLDKEKKQAKFQNRASPRLASRSKSETEIESKNSSKQPPKKRGSSQRKLGTAIKAGKNNSNGSNGGNQKEKKIKKN